jgi:hypothetical protein
MTEPVCEYDYTVPPGTSSSLTLVPLSRGAFLVRCLRYKQKADLLRLNLFPAGYSRPALSEINLQLGKLSVMISNERSPSSVCHTRRARAEGVHLRSPERRAASAALSAVGRVVDSPRLCGGRAASAARPRSVERRPAVGAQSSPRALPELFKVAACCCNRTCEHPPAFLAARIFLDDPERGRRRGTRRASALPSSAARTRSP